MVLLAVLCAVLIPRYMEYSRKVEAYNTAQALLDSGQYVKAASAFDAMGDYQDSAQQAMESRYQYVTAHKTRDDEQTRIYLNELVDAKYKDAAYIENQIYRWDISVVSCGTKAGGLEKSIFSRSEPLFFYVTVQGGHIGEYCHLRFESTISPTLYWQSQGVQPSFEEKDMGTFQNDGYYWYGWENGIQADMIGSVSFSLYNAETNALIQTCTASVY